MRTATVRTGATLAVVAVTALGASGCGGDDAAVAPPTTDGPAVRATTPAVPATTSVAEPSPSPPDRATATGTAAGTVASPTERAEPGPAASRRTARAEDRKQERARSSRSPRSSRSAGTSGSATGTAVASVDADGRGATPAPVAEAGEPSRGTSDGRDGTVDAPPATNSPDRRPAADASGRDR